MFVGFKIFLIALAGLIAGILDYQINTYFRFPIVEFGIFIYALKYHTKITESQTVLIFAIVIAVFVSRLFVGPLWDALLPVIKTVLLMFNLIVVLNIGYKIRWLLHFFIGVCFGWVFVSAALLFEGDILKAKFIFPNLLPIALLLILVSKPGDLRSKAIGSFMIAIQLFALFLIEFRSQLLSYGFALVLLATPVWLSRKMLRFTYLMPLSFFAVAIFMVYSGQFQPNSDLSTKSNIERAILLNTAFEYAQTIPLLGMSTDLFLHYVDIGMLSLTNDALSTTSAHNLYADIIIQFGLPVLIMVIFMFQRLCRLVCSEMRDSNSVRVAGTALCVMFIIFSLTPVSATSRVELLWLAAIISIAINGRRQNADTRV